jgi:hypothetical protein
LVIDDGALKLGFFMYPMKWNLCSNPMTKITLVKDRMSPWQLEANEESTAFAVG